MKHTATAIGLIIIFGAITGLISFNSWGEKSTKDTIASPKQSMDKESQKVFDKLKIRDSLLFELGFNQCDTTQLKDLTSNDFEFYHDQAGITNSQQAFIQSISGLCNMNYKATREVDVNNFSVFLLKNQGKVYGAIQKGKHSFYGEEENKPKYLTSTADFTHLWIIEEGSWKLKRVLSYNHQVPRGD